PAGCKRTEEGPPVDSLLHLLRTRPTMHTTALEPGARPVLLMLPAMGVAAGFYTPFVHRLEQACAATVLTLELPGQGASPLRAASGADYGYLEIVESLIPEAVQRAVAQYPGRP